MKRNAIDITKPVKYFVCILLSLISIVFLLGAGNITYQSYQYGFDHYFLYTIVLFFSISMVAACAAKKVYKEN